MDGYEDIPGHYADEEKDLYEKLTSDESEDDEIYDLNQTGAPIYDRISRKSIYRCSVFGGPNYLATGVHSEGKWDPSFLKGVSSYPPETDINLDDFLKNYEDFVSRINSQRNPEHIQFLLHTVLPDLETNLTKSGLTLDILRIILKLSCIKECPLVTRYALHMILDLFSKISYSTGGVFADFIVQCESCLKESILGQTQGEISTFDQENAEDQGLRIFVYSRALMILYANIVQGLIPLTAIHSRIETFDALVEKLTNLQDQNYFIKKDNPRYAIGCIKETATRASSVQKKKHDEPKNLFHMFLTWLQEHNRSGGLHKSKQDKEVEHFISKIKTSKKGWYDFHVAVLCLGSQIYEKPNNVKVLQTLVENYLKKHSDCARKWSSEREWQTGLVLGNVMEYIVNHNQDRVTRSEACLCLIHCFKSLTKRNSLEKLWVHEALQRCVFGPDKELRQVILDHLELEGDRKEEKVTGNLKEHLPITRSMDYLEQRYKKQLQPRSYYFIGMNNLKGYFLATFRGEKATVKILATSKDDMVREEKKPPSKIHQQLVIEAYTLRRLNSKPHPNILRVFAYDTSAQPYHLITEHVSNGSLLYFLQSSRSQPGHMPGPSALIKMILGVLDAVIYLNDQHLVHLAIMAANFLVGQGQACKLTGFQFVREMTRTRDGRYEYISIHDEMAIRHAAPECFTSGKFSEKSVSWAIGALLFEMHTYGLSPYNQYSNAKGDQIRRHVISGGKLKNENCIRKEVCEVIQNCHQFDRKQRPIIAQLKEELVEVYELLIKEVNDCPDANYPPLTHVDEAKTNQAMNSSRELKMLDNKKSLGFLGLPTASHDGPMIRTFDGLPVVRELVVKTKEADLKKLKNLENPFIVRVLRVADHDRKDVALITENSGRGNLLQMVLAKQYKPEDLVTFAAQIVQAIRYMHDNGIIHSDLRAEHIMVFPTKVKVSRLGRAKCVGKMLDIKCRMPKDAVRWSPPEVIKDGIYSHSSDVYSFGIMCFELFNALSAPKGSTPEYVIPFPTIKDEKILGYLEHSHRPVRPEPMPIWIYIVAKQCLLHKPSERPPFVLMEDTLTSSKPFESCLLSYWKKNHEIEVDTMDLNITQPEMASHVISEENHKTHDELHSLAAVEVFMEHTYTYAEPSSINYQRNKESLLTKGILRQPMQPLRSPSLPPLPPLPGSSENIPFQDSSLSTLTQGYSELSIYASPSNIYKRSLLAHVENKVKAEASVRGQWNKEEESLHSSSTNSESSQVEKTSSYPTPVPQDIGAQQHVHTMVADEGAVGFYQNDEWISLGNTHPEAEEHSWHSVETDRSTSQSPENGQQLNRPVPKPRKK